MEELDKPKQNNLKRIRSKGYPFLSLDDCIKIIEQAAKSGRDLATAELAAFKLTQRGRKPQKSVSKLSSGAFSARRASLRDFGLIDLTKEGIHVTDLSMAIIAGLSEQEKEDAKKKAFFHPELFSAVYKSVPKETLIKKTENLGNKAVSLGVLLKMREGFVKSFVKSGVYVGLIEEKSKDEVILLPDIGHEKRTTESTSIESEITEKQSVLRLPFDGGIELSIPSNELVTQALLDGKLKDVKDGIKKFASEVLVKKENGT